MLALWCQRSCSSACTRTSNNAEGSKPKVAKVTTKSPEKDNAKSSPSTPKPEKTEEQTEGGDQNEDLMKGFLDEANRMLKNLNQADPKEKAVATRLNEERMKQLQKQLDEIKISMRSFRLSKLSQSAASGLLDSGATHPLRARRKGEKISHLPNVDNSCRRSTSVNAVVTNRGDHW